MTSLKFQKPFDWTSILDLSMPKTVPGKQVINFFSTDKDYRNNPESIAFVKKYLANAREFDIDAMVLRYACEQACIDGEFLEMGVCTGRTINFIAALNPEKIIYGFDSFTGMPEDWQGRDDLPVTKGMFANKDPEQLPPVLHNVRLLKGLFKETLPQFSAQLLKNKPIAFLHIDCDIYGSTKDVFINLSNNIVAGTIILFDELVFPEACLGSL